MSGFDYFKKCVTSHYANFDGRARRKEYWYYTLFYMIAATVASFIPYIGIIVSLAMLVPSFAVAIRRMHDVGKSGWYCLIPIYNLILALTEGDRGGNQYGSDPKGGDDLTSHLV